MASPVATERSGELPTPETSWLVQTLGALQTRTKPLAVQLKRPAGAGAAGAFEGVPRSTAGAGAGWAACGRAAGGGGGTSMAAIFT